MRKTASGPDGIPYWVFRNCACELSAIIASLINSSLSQGKVRKTWKHALVTVTPVLKVKTLSEYRGNMDLRPISITSILSRMTERIIVRRYLWPSIRGEMTEDQFGFRPSGSTTSALVNIIHNIYQMFEDGNDYVRCLLIDYSKAFDVINHGILLRELSELGLNRSVFFWIADFLFGRTQSTTAFGYITNKLPISRSIVQGSGIGPMMYVLSARKLTTLSRMNSLSKYADDTTLLVPQHSDRSIEDEFAHIQDWSIDNKLNINKTKTVEIIFWRTSKIKVKYHITNIVEVERVDSVKLLGVFLTLNISWSLQINHLVTGITQKILCIESN